MARFYADENFPQPVAIALRELGHDVLTCLESGRAGQAIPDEEVLSFACSQERAVLTINRRDFLGLHHKSPDRAGVILCTFDSDFEGQARRISEAIAGVERLAGELVRVNRPRR